LPSKTLREVFFKDYSPQSTHTPVSLFPFMTLKQKFSDIRCTGEQIYELKKNQILIIKEETVMQKKIYIRPVSVVLSDEMFNRIKAITDRENIGISEYIRGAIQEKFNNQPKSPGGNDNER